MATGTGKTITALTASAHVANGSDGGLFLVIAVPYQHLVDQWATELNSFGVSPVRAYQSRRNWQPRLEREVLEFNQGSRDVCVVVTTHKTLASDATHQTLRRASGPKAMLIADEVHHMGAPHMQRGLLDEFRLRLGLSATPERWYDDDGTQALNSYFDGTVFEYGLVEAIEHGALCEYYYIPHIVELSDIEMEEYKRLTAKIGSFIAGNEDEDSQPSIEDNPRLQRALFKRARLIGTAEQKLSMLVDLIERTSEPSHSLVYCSDGSTRVDPEAGDRHYASDVDSPSNGSPRGSRRQSEKNS
jgi:superfamily II DNA or RNA helicase